MPLPTRTWQLLIEDWELAGFASSKEVLPQVESLAQKALEIDESLGEAHLILGWLDASNGDRASAETNYKRAIQLNPRDFQAHLDTPCSYPPLRKGMKKRLLRRGRQEN